MFVLYGESVARDAKDGGRGHARAGSDVWSSHLSWTGGFSTMVRLPGCRPTLYSLRCKLGLMARFGWQGDGSLGDLRRCEIREHLRQPKSERSTRREAPWGWIRTKSTGQSSKRGKTTAKAITQAKAMMIEIEDPHAAGDILVETAERGFTKRDALHARRPLQHLVE